jgi:hypothetical protein
LCVKGIVIFKKTSRGRREGGGKEGGYSIYLSPVLLKKLIFYVLTKGKEVKEIFVCKGYCNIQKNIEREREGGGKEGGYSIYLSPVLH